MIAMFRLLVDFRSSMNITTRAAVRNRSPSVTGHWPPEVIPMVKSGPASWAGASEVFSPPRMVSSTRL